MGRKESSGAGMRAELRSFEVLTKRNEAVRNETIRNEPRVAVPVVFVSTFSIVLEFSRTSSDSLQLSSVLYRCAGVVRRGNAFLGGTAGWGAPRWTRGGVLAERPRREVGEARLAERCAVPRARGGVHRGARAPSQRHIRGFRNRFDAPGETSATQ